MRRCTRSVSKVSSRRLKVLAASVPLLLQLTLGSALEAQNSAAPTAIGPRPNRAGIGRIAATTVDSLRTTPDPTPPRDAACIVRDFGIGVLAAGASVLLVTLFVGPLTVAFGGEKDLKRLQRRAFYWGLGLGTAYTLLRLREPCDLEENLLPTPLKK